MDETGGGIRLSMATSANNPTTALQTYNQNSQDRIKSDCINLATNSQELSQDGVGTGTGGIGSGVRRSTKSASRVRVEG